jgi:hypothetical protein
MSDNIIEVSLLASPTIDIGFTSGTIGGQAEHYEHIQAVASDTWMISHGLNFDPNVIAFDNDGNRWDVTPVYNPNKMQLLLIFPEAFAGKAQLS